MKLDRLRIAGFGRFIDTTLSFVPGLNVVFGVNEAGKSTLVECLMRLLFGYPDLHFNDARKRFEPWREGAPYRAALAYTLDDGRALETERDFGRDDVPTTTRDALTKTDVPDLSGSRTASPGAKLLGVSLAAYHAAAVVRAPEVEPSPRDQDGGPRELAERLGRLVGAAGDSSAKQAQDRLDRFAREIGGAPNATTTLLTKARATLSDAEREQRDVAGEFARWHASLQERSRALEALTTARARVAAVRSDLDAAALRDVRRRLHDARDAMAREEAAAGLLRSRGPADAGPTAVGDAEFEDLKVKWILAVRAADEAESRRRDYQTERDALADHAMRVRRNLAAAEAAVRDADAALEALHPKPAPATLRGETVDRLRQQREQVDALERRARTAEAELSVAKLAPRPNLIFFLILAVAALGIVGVAALVKNSVLLYAGFGFCAAALLVLLSYVNTLRQRQDIILDHTRASHQFGDAYRTASDALTVEVSRLGYESVDVLLDAVDMRGKAEALEERRRAARASLDFARGEEQTVARRGDDAQKLEQAAAAAREHADGARAALAAFLDAADVSPGAMGERLDAFALKRRQAGEASRADSDLKVAQAQLTAALGGLTLDELSDEERRLTAAVDAAGVAPHDRPSDRGSASADLKAAQAELERCKDALIALDARLDEFDRRFPGGLAAYEERLAAARDDERRLMLAKAAAEIARDEIARLAEHVHRNFVPILNEAAGDVVAQVTRGRYASAAVDPKDFSVRTLYPENAATGTLDALSTGTREVFALAMRIAVARALGSGERPPVLLDDPLVHADEQRCHAAIAYLQQLGARGVQTILFSQRGSTLDAAREVGANLIELTPVSA